VRCAVVPVARPTFDTQKAAQLTDQAFALLAEIGFELHGAKTLVMTPDDLAKAKTELIDDADLYILMQSSFSDASPAVSLLSEKSAPVLLWSFREPGEIGERLLLNSMCGSNLAAHALVHAGKDIYHLHGNPAEARTKSVLTAVLNGQMPNAEEPELKVDQSLADLEMIKKILDAIRGTKIGAIGDAPPGFTPCVYDANQLIELFGIEVEPLTVDEIFERIASADAGAVAVEYAAAVAAQPSLGSVNQDEATKVSATTVVLDDWKTKSDLAAIAVRCWPEFPTQLGACPCGALSRMADRGTATACERDVLGAVTMLLMEELGAGTTYLVDVVDQDPSQNLIRLWHCGAAATSLAANPADATQFTHCNRKLGVAGNFPLKTGPVVVARLDQDVDPSNPTGLRLIISNGESISAENQFQGNTATVKMEIAADAFVNGLITRGFPHHLVLAWTDIRPQLRQMAKLLSIPLIEW
jgi:L-fucose isomerase-like protein